MLLLTLPGLLYFIVFHYVPLLGYVVAFQDYQPYLGYMHSAWVGFANFTTAFGELAFWSATLNTLEIALIQLVFFFPIPVALALLLNSIVSERIRRFVQSVVYLPHFIGWVIIVSIFQQILGGAGLLPDVLGGMGLPRYDMMSDPDAFPWLLTLQVAWKDSRLGHDHHPRGAARHRQGAVRGRGDRRRRSQAPPVARHSSRHRTGPDPSADPQPRADPLRRLRADPAPARRGRPGRR